MHKSKKRILISVIAWILVLGLVLSLGAGVISTFAASELELQLTEELGKLKEELTALQEQKKQLGEQKVQIEDNKKEIESQIADINDQITALENHHAGLMDEKTNVDTQMNVTEQQIKLTQTCIDSLTVQIAQRERELIDAREEEAEAYELFKTRVRAISEYQDVTEIQMIFTSSSLTDMIVRLRALSDIANNDRNIMKRLAALREKITEIKTELEADQKQEREAAAELEAFKLVLESESNTLDTLLTRLDMRTEESNKALLDAQAQEDYFELEMQATLAEIEAREADIRAQEAKIQEKENAIEEEKKAEAARIAAEKARQAAEEARRKAAEEEARRVAEEARRAAEAAAKAKAAEQAKAKTNQQPSKKPSSYSGSKPSSMTWPCPSSDYISSYYGMRTHPVTGVYKLHNGIDIGAGKNSSIVAAADGTVTTVSFTRAWGNYVIVTHSGGVQTLYAHMTKATCSVGDTVSAGEQIGKVGATGYATGYHLHFTIYVDGVSVDPLKYL